MYTDSFFPLLMSLSALMHYLSVNSDLLISMLSFCVFPVTAVRLYRSLPAKSTSCSFDKITLSGLAGSIYSKVNVNRECERLDEAFILCVPIILFFNPK